MGVVGQQGPGINSGPRLRGNGFHAGNKISPVFFIIINMALFYNPENDMAQSAGGIQSRINDAAYISSSFYCAAEARSISRFVTLDWKFHKPRCRIDKV